MTENEDALLKALISTTGRLAFPIRELHTIVNPTGKASKLVKAFNIADGTRTQVEIARQAKVDQGQLSHAVTRWIGSGVMFRVGEGRDSKLLHVYPLPDKLPKD
jgi:hypothetical protein